MTEIDSLALHYLLTCVGLTAGLGVALYFVVRKMLGASGSSEGVVFPARLTRLAEQLHSTSVMHQSRVGGHVAWERGGRKFYFYEKRYGAAVWSVLAVDIRAKSLPRFQVRTCVAGIPIPAPPVRSTRLSGIEDLDQRFEIRFPAGAPDALPPIGEVWYQVLLVANLCQPPRFVLEVHDNQVRLYFPGTLPVQKQNQPMIVEEGCKLIDAILFKYAMSIPAVAEAAPDMLLESVAGEATCPVCSEGIRADRAECARCATPHHPECWAYAGVCAVFGCGSTEPKAPA